ncbi:hypothetical protein CC86DRAFT_372022 [Ophiobolus disseminans]|uniref:Peptidase A1 domain-containing protein n=1 Tax=Ophiobolus disseminans TaxID=1469910 RepID=A0A6A6ZU04_9PLEO|nr:hypothetical protein CC86DRAFT_372022 [Ophiobolus disseminans]
MRPARADLSQYTESIFLPFTNRFSSEDVTRIRCTIDGEKFSRMPVDTGSTGILIGAPILPNIDPSAGEPAHHFFTSSLRLYVGRLVDLSVGFYGENGSNATATIPVLIVDKSWLCPWYNPSKDGFQCPPGPHGEIAQERDTSKIAYMGVGFGRNCPKDGMPIAAPQVNPFLNIDAINGKPLSKATMRSGYIVTTEGVHLGLTRDNTRGFAFDDLQPGVTHGHDPRDWAMARMSFRINGGPQHFGTVLVDTGIPHMYIRAEDGVSIPTVTIRNPNKHGHAKMVKRVKPGTEITVAFPSFNNPASGYSFFIGEGSAVEPSFVVPGRPSFPPYVNTGRNFLHGYSIAFDATGGRFGFRPVQSSSSSVL